MTKYLIIGNGVAGTTAAETIRANDPDGVVTMVSKENLGFYSRIRLPEFIAGRIGKSDLIIKKDEWYRENRIDLKLATQIVDIDPDRHQAVDQNGNVFDYDLLLMATGSFSFIPPVEGSSRENVFGLRTFEDAENIVKAAAFAENIVVIGGGLLGLEAAHSLISMGKKTVVIEFFDRLLPRQMDQEGALLLKSMLEKQGFEFRLGAKTVRITGNRTVTGVELESGDLLDADMVLFSAGVRPDLGLAEKAGLKTDMGVIVNSRMQTEIENIYAAGDVARFEQTNFCIWPEANEQGRVAGANMSGKNEEFSPVVPSNRLKVAGINLASAGDIDPENRFEAQVEQNADMYRKIVKKNGKTAGCIMLGNTEGFSRIVKQMAG
jgi:nitrite reductase (NADH) large subunit